MRKLALWGREFEPDVRMLGDMASVVMDQEWFRGADDRPLYFMYRGVHPNEADKALMDAVGMRYDVTVIPPGMLGSEYTKTAGHDHPPSPAGPTFTEVYEVLEGRATYLMQKVVDGEVVDAYYVECGPGDRAIIPPDYGHVTINAGTEDIKMANWVFAGFSSVYDAYRARRGAAYYLTDEGWRGNPRYGELPELRRLAPSEPSLLGLRAGEKMYTLVNDLGRLEFLRSPEKYGELWENILGRE